MLTKYTVILVVLALGINACEDVPRPTEMKEDSFRQELLAGKIKQGMVREGHLIRAVAFDLLFEIPSSWIRWHEENEERPNLHLTAAELRRIEHAEGEWDEEFARVVNQMLPFEQCIAHVGQEGWGAQGISYNDLQVRVYILTDGLDEIKDTLQARVAAATQTLAGASVVPFSEIPDAWNKMIVTYPRFYEDYGAVASVDFRVKQFHNISVVIAYMYTDHADVSDSIASIQRSVRVMEEG